MKSINEEVVAGNIKLSYLVSSCIQSLSSVFYEAGMEEILVETNTMNQDFNTSFNKDIPNEGMEDDEVLHLATSTEQQQPAVASAGRGAAHTSSGSGGTGEIFINVDELEQRATPLSQEEFERLAEKEHNTENM